MSARGRLSPQDDGGPGWWFITCVCVDRASLLGVIHADGAVVTSPIGDLVCGAWSGITRVRPWITVDQMVVMPDHVHGLLCIGDAPPGSATSLSQVVNGFKGAVTRLAREHQLLPRSTVLWQRSFDARLLTSPNAVARARRYILDNPRRAVSAMSTQRFSTQPAAAQRAADPRVSTDADGQPPAAAQRAAECFGRAADCAERTAERLR